jgi:hypothetical protein
MKSTVQAAAIIALACAAWLLCECALTARAWRGIPDAALLLASDHMTAVETLADERLASIEQHADNQVTAARRDITQRLDALLVRADERTGEALDRADARVGQAIERADARLGEVTTQTGSTAAAVNRTIATMDPWLDCGGPGEGQGKDCLQRKVWWMTLKADAALTEVATAAPKIVDSVQASTLSAQQAAASAAMTSQNLAALTKPGPKWLRYAGIGLAIVVPASQIALPLVVGATGKRF